MIERPNIPNPFADKDGGPLPGHAEEFFTFAKEQDDLWIQSLSPEDWERILKARESLRRRMQS